MVNISRGKVMACMAISLILLIAFSSETTVAHQIVHLSKTNEKMEDILQESKLSVSGSSSHVSHHGNQRRGNNGGRRLLQCTRVL
ncbi:hypothetical protein LINPERPRIM_LOCUS27052 [Linum perenne]